MFEYICLLYYSANICDSTPCKNGGTCSISGHTYTCSCQDGFYGNECQGTLNIYLIMSASKNKSKRSWRNY